MPGPRVKRKLSTDIYLGAFVLTVLIFSLGIYIGMIIDETAKGEVESNIETLEEDLYLSRILLLVGEETGEFCPIYSEKLVGVDAERELIGERLEYLETVRGVYDEGLRKKYYYLEFENYLLMKKMQNECGGKQVLVLYFYDGSAESSEQGKTLDALRAGNEDVKVFSFDGESDFIVVKVLREQYLVRDYPAVVLDGKRQLGVQSLEALEELISG